MNPERPGTEALAAEPSQAVERLITPCLLTAHENGPIAEIATGPTLRDMERRGFDAKRSEAANAAGAQPLTPWLQID